MRDMDDTYLQLNHASDTAMDDLIGHSITYRIPLGVCAGILAVRRFQRSEYP